MLNAVLSCQDLVPCWCAIVNALLKHVLASHRIGTLDESPDCYMELWVGFGRIALGWAEAELGDVQQGIEQMQQGLAAYRATETKIFYPTFLASLADQLNKTQQIEEGLAVIAQALTCSEQTEEGYALAELHRIKGELLVNRSGLLSRARKRRHQGC
jgi:predicted ATPase